jgi:hypothetical protein
MAVGNLVGNNLLNAVILAVDDMFYTQGPPLAAAAPRPDECLRYVAALQRIPVGRNRHLDHGRMHRVERRRQAWQAGWRAPAGSAADGCTRPEQACDGPFRGVASPGKPVLSSERLISRESAPKRALSHRFSVSRCLDWLGVLLVTHMRSKVRYEAVGVHHRPHRRDTH